MNDRTFAADAIDSTNRSVSTYVKFLSANDSGATGAHQSGFLIGSKAQDMTIGTVGDESVTKRTGLRITWQDGLVTGGTFTKYASKRGEMRLTGMGKGFPYRHPDFTGALWVFCKVADKEYESYVLNTDDEINEYLDTFSLGPQDTNIVLNGKRIPAESIAIGDYVGSLGVTVDENWPTSTEISREARRIRRLTTKGANYSVKNPDVQLIEYVRIEYAIFRMMEAIAYHMDIIHGFENVEEFVAYANKVLNRRKSRAGKSLEHHLASLFRENELLFDEQVVTEEKKRPDFVFPSGIAYHDPLFPADRLVVLGAKTTCKDRWRQIITEADRVRNLPKYLVTLQQGISPHQLDEMDKAKVRLVVPKSYIKSFPRAYQQRIWPLKTFIGYVHEVCDA